MTNEEKARAYDEALKDMRVIYPNLGGDAKLAVEHAFPELAESEDEKIRKEMIRYFTEMKKGGSAALPYDDCIAYLERQKETGIQWLKSDNVKNPDKPYIDKIGMFYTTDGRMCYASEIEKQKEDEGYEAIPVESTLEYKLGFKAGKESEKQKEQKPAEWSEEDEKMRNEIIHFFESLCSCLATEERHTENRKWLKFLKSLRPSWKPNEQEKGALKTAIHVLTEERSFPKAAAHLQSILDAFDGKETRKEWKPSEEQIKAVEHAYNSFPNDCPTKSNLRRLFFDLKELM